MKRISMLGMLMACAVMVASCAKEDTGSRELTADGKIPVKFSMKTNGLMAYATKAPSSSYDVDGFRIFAFKQSGSDWLFTEELDLTNPVYTPNATGSTGGVFTGVAVLEEGVYRFVPTYGLNATGAGFTISDFTADAAWNNTTPVSITHTTGSMPEIFTLDSNFDEISNYTVALNVANADYTATISRAVARVDVVIVRATGNQTNYTEAADAASVFGNKTLETVTMEFTGVNPSMNYLGALPATSTPFNYTYTIGAGADAEVSADVLIGTAATGATYGTSGYQGYNSVAAGDVLQGAAHMYGPFLIPNANATATQGVTLNFIDSEGTSRPITLPAGSLPLERNYVTIIKIYLLENGDGTNPPDIWSENVNFAVTMSTEYAGNHEVDGGPIGGQPAAGR